MLSQANKKGITVSTATTVPATGGREIDRLLPLLIRDIGAIPKTHRNKAQSYDFRSIEDGLAKLQPLLVAHGVGLVPTTHALKTEAMQEPKPGGGVRTIYRTTLLLKVELRAPDGSSVTMSAAGEGQDYGGDKATPKALSQAFKYVVFLGFCVPVQDGLEDSDRDERAAPAATPPPVVPSPAPAVLATTATGQVLAAMVETHGGDCACQPEQINQIYTLALLLQIPPDALRDIIRRRGVGKAKQLTGYQAAEIIARLRAKAEEKGLVPF